VNKCLPEGFYGAFEFSSELSRWYLLAWSLAQEESGLKIVGLVQYSDGTIKVLTCHGTRRSMA
jgi:hypothetical protein